MLGLQGVATGDEKVLFADILSALAMTRTANGKRELLKYKMEGNRKVLAEWGHEYVRSLAGEIGQVRCGVSTLLWWFVLPARATHPSIFSGIP